MRLALLATAAAVALCTCASAQPVPEAAPLPSRPAEPAPAAPIANDSVSSILPTPPNACCRLAAGVLVELELAQEVSTKTVKPGDHFALSLASPIVVDGKVVAPAGARGEGEVIDASGGGFGGKPAKLVLAARYVEFDGHRLALHAFKLSGAGRNNSDVAMAASFVPYAGLLAIAIPGGGVGYPAGTRASAKVAAEVILPPRPEAPPPVVATIDPQSTAKQGTTP